MPAVVPFVQCVLIEGCCTTEGITVRKDDRIADMQGDGFSVHIAVPRTGSDSHTVEGISVFFEPAAQDIDAEMIRRERIFRHIDFICDKRSFRHRIIDMVDRIRSRNGSVHYLNTDRFFRLNFDTVRIINRDVIGSDFLRSFDQRQNRFFRNRDRCNIRAFRQRSCRRIHRDHSSV